MQVLYRPAVLDNRDKLLQDQRGGIMPGVFMTELLSVKPSSPAPVAMTLADAKTQHLDDIRFCRDVRRCALLKE